MNDSLSDLSSEFKALSLNKLQDIRETVADDLEFMSQYVDYWSEFNAKYKLTIESLDMLSKIDLSKDRKTLIKIGEFLYTEGRIQSTAKVLVYIGGEYFAKMSLEDAKALFQRKAKSLAKDAEEFEEGNTNKEEVFMAIEDAIRTKINEISDNDEAEEN